MHDTGRLGYISTTPFTRWQGQRYTLWQWLRSCQTTDVPAIHQGTCQTSVAVCNLTLYCTLQPHGPVTCHTGHARTGKETKMLLGRHTPPPVTESKQPSQSARILLGVPGTDHHIPSLALVSGLSAEWGSTGLAHNFTLANSRRSVPPSSSR